MKRLYFALLRRLHALADACYRLEARLAGVRMGRGVSISGRPNILIVDGRIELGDKVELRSRDFGYHTQIPAPVKLFVDAPGAEIKVGARSRLNGCCLHAKMSIVIGEDCLLAAGCTIIDQDGHVLEGPARARGERDAPAAVKLGHRVWAGHNVTILKGVEIGDDVVIAAGSVVSHNIRSGVLCGGVPARVVSRITDGAANLDGGA